MQVTWGIRCKRIEPTNLKVSKTEFVKKRPLSLLVAMVWAQRGKAGDRRHS